MAITPINSAINKFTNSKLISKWINYYGKNPTKALAYATIASVAIKDGVGCAMYVTQSLNNKKIPDERRKFVAALDLTNGLLMIVSQICLFFAMRKLNKPLFNKIFHKTFDSIHQTKKNVVTQMRINQKKAGLKHDRKLTLNKVFEEIKSDSFKAFEPITELVASTIIAKRVLVPLIATPLADKVKKKMDEKEQSQNSVKSNDSYEKQEDKVSPQKSEATSDDTNLLDRYKKYYGPIQLDK